MISRQEVAAVNIRIAEYEKALRHDIRVGQVFMFVQDTMFLCRNVKTRWSVCLNLALSLARMRNDTLVTSEVRFGDNDHGPLVANIVRARFDSALRR